MLKQSVRSRRFARSIVIASLMWVGVASSADAVQIYTYTGNPFTGATGAFSTTDFVTVTFTLTAALAPDTTTNLLTSPSLVAGSLIWSAGPLSLSLADTTSVVTRATLVTDATGAITSWYVAIRSGADADFPDQDRILTCNNPPFSASDCATTTVGDAANFGPLQPFPPPDNAFVLNNPGTWSVVPEPSTAALAGFGLLALGAIRRRRRS